MRCREFETAGAVRLVRLFAVSGVDGVAALGVLDEDPDVAERVPSGRLPDTSDRVRGFKSDCWLDDCVNGILLLSDGNGLEVAARRRDIEASDTGGDGGSERSVVSGILSLAKDTRSIGVFKSRELAAD